MYMQGNIIELYVTWRVIYTLWHLNRQTHAYNNKFICYYLCLLGFLLIATVCTQCQSIGYPKIKPDNPLELPTLNYDDKPNLITDSASQHSSSTAQDITDTPEQVPSDDIPDKIISIPQVIYTKFKLKFH